MEVRLFDEFNDLFSIESFLESRKVSHGHDYYNSKSWFKWKFLNSPSGKAIMPTVFDKNEILGANYYGIYPLKRSEKKISGIMPYEIFVHEKCQGKGLFKKCISLAEAVAKKNKIQIMMAFPNKKSIQGFMSLGWTYIPNSIIYWIKPKWTFNFMVNILDLKKGFKPVLPKTKNNFSFSPDSNNLYTGQVRGDWNQDYLSWRFNQLPQAKYIQIKNNSFEIIARLGFRGKLKETQVLYVNFLQTKFERRGFKKIIKNLAKTTNTDLLSFPMSEHYPIYHEMKNMFFYKLPSRSQFVYKVLDTNLKNDNLKFSLCGLEFHTY